MTKNLGNKELMAQNIKRYLNLKGMTGKDLADELNVPVTTVYSWLQGASYPRIDKIEMMANFFGINKSDLVEEYKFKTKEDILESAFFARPEMRTLFSVAEDCTTEEIEQAIKIIEALKK